MLQQTRASHVSQIKDMHNWVSCSFFVQTEIGREQSGKHATAQKLMHTMYANAIAGPHAPIQDDTGQQQVAKLDMNGKIGGLAQCSNAQVSDNTHGTMQR